MGDRKQSSSVNAFNSDAVVNQTVGAMEDLMPEMKNRHETLPLLKVVLVAIFISLTLKLSAFIVFDRNNELLPVVDPFFPSFFGSQWSARVVYLLACSSCLLSVLATQKKHLVALTGGMLICLSMLSIHQSSFNDVTFVCCAWTSLWCFWLASRLDEPFDSLFPRAVFLSHVILSLVFLGGAVGKFSPGYWSGEVLYEIYFEKRDFWIYNLLRNWLSHEGLRDAATWHSRLVILSELGCSFLWLLPARLASAIAVLMLCGIALTNNFLLFSVVTCLIGLAIIGLHHPSTDRESPFPSADR